MKIREIKVYSFDELSEKAKQYAREHYELEHYWYAPIYEDFVEECTKYGLNIDFQDISFSGFCCQGDGASFVCKDIDVEKLIKSLNITFKHKLEKLFTECISVSINRISYQYSHKYTVRAYVDTDTCYLDAPTIYDYFYKKGEELEKKLEDLKDDLCTKLYNDLENYYDELMSAEHIDEEYIENEYDFYESGVMA